MGGSNVKRVDPPVLAALLSAITRANEELATTNVFAVDDHSIGTRIPKETPVPIAISRFRPAYVEGP